jgi:hypothetical protein
MGLRAPIMDRLVGGWFKEGVVAGAVEVTSTVGAS